MLLRFSVKLKVLCIFVTVLTSTVAQDTTNNSPDTTVAIADAVTEHATSTTTASTTAAPSSTTTTADENRKKYFTLDDVPTCKQQDAKLNECLKNIFEMALIKLKGGDKELNIPPLDPLQLNKTTIQAAWGPVNGRLILRNSLVYGFADTKFKSLDFKAENGKTYINAIGHVSEVRIKGDYKADVTVNNVHMRPKGTFNLTLSNVDIPYNLDGDFYDKDDHRFVRVAKFHAEPTVGDVSFNATGIFPDPSLNDLVVNILNQYWRELYRVLLPETRKFWAPMIVRVLNEAMTVVPYDNFVT